MRRLLLLCVLALGVGVGLAACGDKGTVSPLPETVEGELEAPEIAIGDATAGAGAFVAAGCGGCHVLAGVDGATGALGPDLNESLVGQDAAFIQQSIVNPDAVIAEGFDAGLMPAGALEGEDLADVVALLLEGAGS